LLGIFCFFFIWIFVFTILVYNKEAAQSHNLRKHSLQGFVVRDFDPPKIIIILEKTFSHKDEYDIDMASYNS
jgi:hypothetical protein